MLKDQENQSEEEAKERKPELIDGQKELIVVATKSLIQQEKNAMCLEKEGDEQLKKEPTPTELEDLKKEPKALA